MCEHLAELESELKKRGIKETYRGEAWSKNAREWVYYDCILVLNKLRARFALPDFVMDTVNNDERSGLESGFYCERCHDAIMGLHPRQSGRKLNFE